MSAKRTQCFRNDSKNKQRRHKVVIVVRVILVINHLYNIIVILVIIVILAVMMVKIVSMQVPRSKTCRGPQPQQTKTRPHNDTCSDSKKATTAKEPKHSYRPRQSATVLGLRHQCTACACLPKSCSHMLPP